MMLATPPVLDRVRLEWVVVGVALLAPWVWLAVLDWLLRRTR